MENEIIPQPLDTLMTKLGLVNADLVNASTEQLSFKMVQKGRKGRRLSTNIQEKILRALLSVKPELKVKRRELFVYEPSEMVVEKVDDANSAPVFKSDLGIVLSKPAEKIKKVIKSKKAPRPLKVGKAWKIVKTHRVKKRIFKRSY